MVRKYLAAVSGGPDSMALLDLYRDIIKVVCHVNYKKRVDSDYDQGIVEKYCEEHGIKCYSKVLTDVDYEPGGNFQSLARQIRYDFFVEVAQKENLDTILIAHNLNDHLETAYMNIKRKSLAPFYGIKKINHYKNLKIIRPLITIKKDDLQWYCDYKQTNNNNNNNNNNNERSKQ